jgi:hypothetical protein
VSKRFSVGVADSMAQGNMRGGLALIAMCLGCDKLHGFGGDVPPLVTIQVEATGDVTTVIPPGQSAPSLNVALIWGAQWVSELICILPPESDAMAAVLAAGCRDPFGFVPLRVAAVAPAEPNVPTELSLYSLPSADTLVGTLTSRVAYASVIVFDHHDASGTLELGMPDHTASGDDGGDDMGDYMATNDIVYGASFNSMTEPDQRLAFREGSFNVAAAFYPRHGCGDPPLGFSIVAAGGFSAAAAIAAAMQGELPSEDPTTCVESAPASASIQVQLRKPDDVRESICAEPDDITARYLQPPVQAPDLTGGRVRACGHIPDFGDASANMIQVVVSGRSDDPCKSLTHYVLRGCFEGPTCTFPDWDYTATPPSWWHCQ